MSDRSAAEINASLNKQRPIGFIIGYCEGSLTEFNNDLKKIGMGVHLDRDGRTRERPPEQQLEILRNILDKASGMIEFHAIPHQIDMYDAIGETLFIFEVTEYGISFYFIYAACAPSGRLLDLCDTREKDVDEFFVFVPFSNIKSISSFQGNFKIKNHVLDS